MVLLSFPHWNHKKQHLNTTYLGNANNVVLISLALKHFIWTVQVALFSYIVPLPALPHTSCLSPFNSHPFIHLSRNLHPYLLPNTNRKKTFQKSRLNVLHFLHGSKYLILRQPVIFPFLSAASSCCKSSVPLPNVLQILPDPGKKTRHLYKTNKASICFWLLQSLHLHCWRWLSSFFFLIYRLCPVE